ncbi:MAG: hypothetical protein PVSMB8_17320 [Vulcanimicrobiaceae bacterium]
MPIASVDVDPLREAYAPGDVLNVAVHFEMPFVGQVEAGLAPRADAVQGPPQPAIFAHSSDYLYEGQVHVRQRDVGECVLLGRLTSVGDEPRIVALRDATIYVRPSRP